MYTSIPYILLIVHKLISSSYCVEIYVSPKVIYDNQFWTFILPCKIVALPPPSMCESHFGIAYKESDQMLRMTSEHSFKDKIHRVEITACFGIFQGGIQIAQKQYEVKGK